MKRRKPGTYCTCTCAHAHTSLKSGESAYLSKVSVNLSLAALALPQSLQLRICKVAILASRDSTLRLCAAAVYRTLDVNKAVNLVNTVYLLCAIHMSVC